MWQRKLEKAKLSLLHHLPQGPFAPTVKDLTPSLGEFMSCYSQLARLQDAVHFPIGPELPWGHESNRISLGFIASLSQGWTLFDGSVSSLQVLVRHGPVELNPGFPEETGLIPKPAQVSQLLIALCNFQGTETLSLPTPPPT